MRSLAPDSGSSFREREIGERRQPGGGSSSPLSPPPSPGPRPPPPRAAPPPARLGSPPLPPQEGEKRREERGRREERRGGGGGRRGSGGRRRRWRRPQRNERGAGESGAQSAAPRPGRARALRIARSRGVRTFPAPGGLQQAGGGEGACVRQRGRSRGRPARPGAGRGRRRHKELPHSGRPPATRGAPGDLQLAGSSLHQRGRCCWRR